MIGFLRFIGVMNAAVWLGTAVFFTFGAARAIFSSDMLSALNTQNQVYQGTIAQVIMVRYFHFHLACAIIALVHLLAEWLYMGRPARKFSTTLLVALFALTLLGGNWLQPKLKDLNAIHYSPKKTPAEQQAAAKSFTIWHVVAQISNLFMMAGLVVYMWRTANPPDTLRFVSPVKFRG